MMGRGRQEKVSLTEEQRDHLEKISRHGQAPAKKILHSTIKDFKLDKGA